MARGLALTPFVLFGPDHLAALALTALVAAGLALAARRRPEGALARALRFGLAGGLLASVALYLLAESRRRPLDVWDFVPLHLCDFLILLAAFALATRQRLACELVYFWTGAGALLAMITPDVAAGFPDPRFLIFFGFHGLVVAAAALVTFGLGVRPGPGAPWRAFLLTNVYAALVGLVDVAFGANFLYLRDKPAGPTLLDWLGPWPVYVLVVEVLALALFQVLFLPFRALAGAARLD